MKRILTLKSSPLCSVPNVSAGPCPVSCIGIVRHLIRVVLVNTSQLPAAEVRSIVDSAAPGSLPNLMQPSPVREPGVYPASERFVTAVLNSGFCPRDGKSA